MLVPLTRKKFEELIPILATGPQYAYYGGKFPEFLRRLLISIVSVCVVVFILGYFILGENGFTFSLAAVSGFYWLWGPIYWASLRNFKSRRFAYAGFWRGEVLDLFISEELIGKEQTVNERGQLVIIENRERRLNIEVGDETGFSTSLQVPLRRVHKALKRGQTAEMVVMSNQSNLSSISKASDIYIPSQDLWVSDYPFVRRDIFVEVSRRLRSVDDSSYFQAPSEPQSRSPRNQSRRRQSQRRRNYDS